MSTDQDPSLFFCCGNYPDLCDDYQSFSFLFFVGGVDQYGKTLGRKESRFYFFYFLLDFLYLERADPTALVILMLFVVAVVFIMSCDRNNRPKLFYVC